MRAQPLPYPSDLSTFCLHLFLLLLRSLFFLSRSNMGGWIFIDTDKVRSTCATKAEVLKFLLWVGSHSGTAARQHDSSISDCMLSAPQQLRR